MSQTENQLDSGGCITDMEPPRKTILEVLQFEIASIRGCILYTNLNNNFSYNCVSRQVGFFFSLDCEESTFWFSLLSCTVGYALPNPKL